MSDDVLRVFGLTKVYQRRGRAPVVAVNGMSFSVRTGQVFGLLGPNGAGKTTLLKVLTTLLPPTDGHAEVMGFDVVARPLEVRRRIAVMLQETAVEMWLTVRDNLLTHARFHGLSPSEARRRATDILDRFQLTTEADRKAQDLSGGFRRRLQLVKTFMVDSPLMFLDEFSTGMDPLLRRSVIGYLREEASRGRTIILTTHILSEAEELCDEILIMNRGRQVARGDLHSLKLLSANLYEVSMTFEQLPASLQADLSALSPLRLEIAQNTVEFAMRAEEARVLDLVSDLSKKGRVLRMELSGPTLEDVFVGLLGASGSVAASEKESS